MRCPKCGYVSFDHLQACKKCGADLQEGKRRLWNPAFGSPPGLSSEPPVTKSDATRPRQTPQGPEDRSEGEELAEILADLSGAPARVPTPGRGAQETAAFCIPSETVTGLNPLPGIVPPASATWTDVPESIRLADAPKAGFWIRMAAWITDIVCLFMATILLALVGLTTIWFGGRLGGEINDQVMALAGYSSAIIVMGSGFLYFTLFVGALGQTPGKMLFGLRIVRVDGEEMTYGRACLRSLGWILSLLVFSIGFLMIPFARQKQGLHDKLAGTYVIRTRHRL